MSEIAATETAAAPVSTADIAASVSQEYEQQSAESTGLQATDTTTDGTAYTGATETQETAQQEQPTAAELSAAAKFLEKQGHKARTADGRDTWFKFKTAEKMLERFVEEHRGEWNGARGELERERDTYRGHLETLRSEIERDPDAYIADLAANFPAYRKFLQPQPQAQSKAATVDDRPKPDVDLGNGQFAYSVEQNEKLIEWKARQLLDERMKPWEDSQKQAQERQQAEAYRARLGESVNKQMADAQTWEGFGKLPADGQPLTEFQTEVLNEMRKESEAAKAAGWNPRDPGTAHLRPTMTVRQAYLEVKNRTVAKETRQSTLQQLKAAPKAPTVGRTGGESPKVKGQSTADIARQVARELGG